jgi:hypothetical protein
MGDPNSRQSPLQAAQPIAPTARTPHDPRAPKEKPPPAPCGQARSIPEGDFYPSPGQPPQVASLGTRPPHRPILKGLSNPQSNARPRPPPNRNPGTVPFHLVTHRHYPPPSIQPSGVRGSVRAPLDPHLPNHVPLGSPTAIHDKPQRQSGNRSRIPIPRRVSCGWKPVICPSGRHSSRGTQRCSDGASHSRHFWRPSRKAPPLTARS